MFSTTDPHIPKFKPVLPEQYESPGIYVFVDAEGSCLYIGQTRCFQARYRVHCKKPWFANVDHTLFHEESDPDTRLWVETRLILINRPRHNRHVRLNLRANGSIYETQFLNQSYRKPRRKSSGRGK